MIKNENGLKDPRNRRGLPENFKEEMQNAPGVHVDMDPVPDSGEDKYVGCGRLKGRKAFITGGDSGIGRAIAIAYAREGADVTINYLSEENKDVSSLIELLAKEGIKIQCIPGDISSEEEAKQTIRKAEKMLGQIDILVLNAGTQRASHDLEEITKDQLLSTFYLNVFSPFWMVQEIYKDMPKGSCIIFSASSEYYKPSPKLTEYAASKYAVVGLSRSLAKQLIENGIRVNTVCPGSTWTPLEVSGGLKKEDIPTHGSGSLMKRSAQPYEIAGVYVFLASEEASFVTCAVYGVDGGMQTV